jgi:hypothetical protein
MQNDEDEDQRRRLAVQPISVTPSQPRGNTSLRTTAAAPLIGPPALSQQTVPVPPQPRSESSVPAILANTGAHAMPINSGPAKAAPVVGPAAVGQAPPDPTAERTEQSKLAAEPIMSRPGQNAVNDVVGPNTAGVAGLWARADNVHNPFLRVLAKVGAGAARSGYHRISSGSRRSGSDSRVNPEQ